MRIVKRKRREDREDLCCTFIRTRFGSATLPHELMPELMR